MKYLFVFDKSKLQILKALYGCQDDVCGCDMVRDLDMPKNLLSYHIRILRKEGFVNEAKCGNRKIYTLSKDKKKDIKKILEAVHII